MSNTATALVGGLLLAAAAGIGGYGYGLNSKTFEPFIGVGVTYNLFK